MLKGSAMSLSSFSPSECIVGIETGHLLKCTLDRYTDLKTTSSSPRLANPIVFEYTPHVGAVESIALSPYHRKAFLSASRDGTAKLYNTLSVS